ncbi:type IV pilin protein [Povalibacter sp.]|uniref:type IV pilin protein n=1 Tax=Povalibacter sp. TaxID=1962978 RepID=UPI002F4213FE
MRIDLHTWCVNQARPAMARMGKDMQPRQTMRGVTLIELMIVIVVVAILASIAIPSYRSYLIRTNRTEARMALLRVQAAQEKFFLQNNRYADIDEWATAPPNGLGVLITTPSGYYTLGIDNYTTTTYTAVATATGGQTDDKVVCRTLKIDQNGTRAPADSAGCWK